MPLAHIDAVVRLKEDVLNHGKRCGDEGVVKGVWLSPGDFLYEVVFPKCNGVTATRVLLRAEQLEVVE